MPSESRQIFRAETFNIRYTSAEPSCQTESAKTRAPELGKKPEGSPTSNSRGRSELSRFGVPQTASREIEHRLTTSATSPLKDDGEEKTDSILSQSSNWQKVPFAHPTSLDAPTLPDIYLHHVGGE
ncbi:hypothetical protein PGTUg99_030081 [Puccinia graminis f. sp. tritici]|uniref:Uncharacterized protein n=1 Tax=Puccinia graminis f. sp. tritici TaxID=56615 RepID=A0A5B0SDF7_PUCGR|nr:hypothetical protein PGTUg99_030081 [Puccinia graminis f. sp. tritici]